MVALHRLMDQMQNVSAIDFFLKKIKKKKTEIDIFISLALENSNNEDSDQLSCIEVDSSSHEDLQTTMRTLSNSLLQSQGK